MRYLISTLFAFAHLSFSGHAANHEHHDMSEPDQATELSGESVYNAAHAWTNSEGKKVNLTSLQGKPRVIAMVYTSCQKACPIITADLKKIEMKLPVNQRDRVGFALFSFDPARDVPENLQKYADKKELNKSRWDLFTSNEAGVRELAAILGVRYKKNKDGEFTHSNIIFVLDAAGKVQHQQVGLNQDPSETLASLQRILKTN